MCVGHFALLCASAFIRLPIVLAVLLFYFRSAIASYITMNRHVYDYFMESLCYHMKYYMLEKYVFMELKVMSVPYSDDDDAVIQ